MNQQLLTAAAYAATAQASLAQYQAPVAYSHPNNLAQFSISIPSPPPIRISAPSLSSAANFLENAGQAAAQGVSQGATGLYDGASSAATDAANGVTRAATDVYDGATSAAAEVADGATRVATAGWNGLTGAATDAWNGATGAATDVANGVTRAATGAWDWTEGVATEAWGWSSGAANDAWGWTEGAADDAWGWTSGAATDAWVYTEGAATDVWNRPYEANEAFEMSFFGGAPFVGGQFVEILDKASNDQFSKTGKEVRDWFSGAGGAAEDWATGAVYDIGHWTVSSSKAAGESLEDVWAGMGRFRGQVEAEIQQEIDKVEDWGEDVHANLRGVGKGIEEQVIALEDMFLDMGEFAADIYGQAEDAVGDAKDELNALGDAVLREAMMVKAEIDNYLHQMEDWTETAMENLEEAMAAAGKALEQLGDDIHDSAAAQKMRVILLGFVQETNDLAMHIYDSTLRTGRRIESEGLNNVIAGGIEQGGDAYTHFVKEQVLNEVGGNVAKFATIPATMLGKAVGMERQANEFKSWLDYGVKSYGETFEKVSDEQFDTTALLFRDPDAWGRRIQAKPWLLLHYVLPIKGTGLITSFTFAEMQLRDFFEYDLDLEIPNDWVDNL